MNTNVNPLPAATARTCAFTLLIVIGLAALAPVAEATKTETWNLWGKTYTKVRVQEVTPASVTIFHSGGILQLELDELPEELQQRFDYDPEKAALWKEQAKLDVMERQSQSAPAVDLPPAAPEKPAEPAQTRKKGLVIVPEEVQYREEVDLRPFYYEHGLFMKNQGRRPSCSVFAIVSALEYESAQRTGKAESLSEEFLIWATRQIQPGIAIDDGYHFAEVITALQTYGVAPHEMVPNTYGKNIDTILPSAEAIAAAEVHTAVIPVWFRRNDPFLIERIVGALNEGKPVIVGVHWPHWRTLETNNLLRDQVPLNGGGHAVTLVGYRNPGGTVEETTFIFRNSYGQAWGMAGCGFMAGSYLKENVISALYLNLP